MLQIEDSILHEDGVAKEYSIGKSRIRNPSLVLEKLIYRLSYLVLKKKW